MRLVRASNGRETALCLAEQADRPTLAAATSQPGLSVCLWRLLEEVTLKMSSVGGVKKVKKVTKTVSSKKGDGETMVETITKVTTESSGRDSESLVQER